MAIPSFDFYRTPRLLFGRGSLSSVAPLSAQYGRRVLLLTGAASFPSSKYWNDLTESFQKNGLEWKHAIISGEPSCDVVDAVVEEFRREDINTVIAVGGGSVLDGGKAVSAMLPLHSGSVLDFLEGVGYQAHDGVKTPFLALPTTAGTGSEATKNAVLSQVGVGGFKKSLRHHHFVPDAAIIDPHLSISCPPEVTGACGLDAMTQLIESYVSTGSSPLTDTLALTGLHAVKRSLLHAFHDPQDLNSREEMAYAAFLSGVTLANAGLGLVHGLSSAIGSLVEIPHGIICGTLLGRITEATIQALLEKEGALSLTKYARLGALFQGQASGDLEEDAFFLVDLIDYYVEKLSLPLLGNLGFTREHMEVVLKGDHHKCNPGIISQKKIQEILLEQI